MCGVCDAMLGRKSLLVTRALAFFLSYADLSNSGLSLAARPLVYALDSFDIDPAGAAGYRQGGLLGQSPRTGCGWSGGKAWEGDAISVGVVSEHLKSSIKGFYATPGCGWHDPTGVNSQRTAYRIIDQPLKQNPYFASFIIHTGWQFLDGADSAESALVGFGHQSSVKEQAPKGVMIGFRGRFEEREIDIIARYSDGLAEQEEQVLASSIDDGSYHILLRVDRAPENGVELTRYWINPWNAETEERATETARHMGSIKRRVDSGGVPIDCFAIKIDSWDRKFFFDEVRLADSFGGLTTDRPRSPSRRWLAYSVFAIALFLVLRTARNSSRRLKQQP